MGEEGRSLLDPCGSCMLKSQDLNLSELGSHGRLRASE